MRGNEELSSRIEWQLDRFSAFIKHTRVFRDETHGIDFCAEVVGDSVVFAPLGAGTKEERISRATLRRFYEQYLKSKSLDPGDYRRFRCLAYLIQALKQFLELE